MKRLAAQGTLLSSFFLLLAISSCVLSFNSPPKYLNITTFSTYSVVSPGVTSPGAEDARGKLGVTGAAQDSSAAASDHSSQSAGVPGAQGSRHPAQLLGKPSGEGHWATPAPHSSIELPYVPYKMFAQVRHTYEVNHKPQSDAIAAASTAEEAAAAARLRESIQTKKISEVYSEEGYEDSAYDHAGFKKDAGFSEGHEGHVGARSKKGNIDKDGGISEAATTSEEQKYPFHKVPSSEVVPILSPLRYALNPASGSRPAKSEGGTEFYDSTESVECPVVVDLPPIPGRHLRRPPSEEEEGEEGEATEGEGIEKTPQPPPTPPPPASPRLKGLGDKIDCLKRKYFGGDEPLDNPLFKEHVVNVAKNEIRKVKEEAESAKEEVVEAKSEESRDSPVKKEEKVKRVNGKEAEPEASAAFPESVGEDRIGEEAEESSTGGVGAAVEGLPSGSASDSDMQGFYADIMGHIQSATGNIVRQAYRGNNGASSDAKVGRVKPPKSPKSPIIGFFPTQGEGLPGAHYPSILPAPSNPSFGNYAAADDSHGLEHESDEDEEGEEQSGSEREEEEEESDEEDHHHHHHPNFVGGHGKPAAAYLLRPLHTSQTQQEAPFRPSPLLYVHNPNAQRGSAPPPTRLSLHPSPSGGEPTHLHRTHHHHHHHPRHPHHHTSNAVSSFHSSGIRTFLIPAGARPATFSSSPFRYNAAHMRGTRGSGTILIPAPGRLHPKPVFQNGPLYPVRESASNAFNRQLPAGHEFDGLLTATTQTVSITSSPLGFGRPQPLQDLVSSPSIVAHSIDTPRNIEYFTAKDSLPPRKAAQFPQQHHAQSLISQITFTTTEKNLPPLRPYAPAVETSLHASSGEQIEEGGESPIPSDSATQGSEPSDSLASASSPEPGSIERPKPSAEESMETSDSFLEGTVAGRRGGTGGVAVGGVGVAPTRLVTEQVTKKIVKAAIEEANRKRRKNVDEAATASPVTVSTAAVNTAPGSTEEAESKTRGERRRKNRVRSRGMQRGRGEEQQIETASDGGGEAVRGEEKEGERPTKVSRTIDSRRERIRRGEKGASRTRIGLATGDGEPNTGLRRPNGRNRGEPGYNAPISEHITGSDEELAVKGEATDEHEYYASENAKNSGQQSAEDRMGVIPLESRVSQATLGRKHADKKEKSLTGPSSDQSEVPAEEKISSVEKTDNVHSQPRTASEVAPRKMFIEPRVRGETRPRIPKKSGTKTGVVSIQNKSRQTANEKETTESVGNSRSEGRRRESSSRLDPAVKQWEASKGRIISSLEEVADGSRGRSRQRGKANASVVTESRVTRPIVVVETDTKNSPKNQRVSRHREVKETFTSLYAPEEEV